MFYFLLLRFSGRISIHALRTEGDSKSSQNVVCFCSTNTKIRRSDITKYTLSASIKTISCSFTSFFNYLLVRRSQCFSVRFMFAPATAAAHHPVTTAGSTRYAPPSSCKSFPNSKSAGYRIPDQSTASILLSKPHIEPHPAGIQTLNFVRAARDQHKFLQLCASVCVRPVFLCLRRR